MNNRLFSSRKLLFLFFIAMLLLLCSEIVARVYMERMLHKSSSRKFRFNSYRIYEHQPGFREGDGDKDWIVINNNGFRRVEDISKQKPEKTFRAFFLGGSAAHGISSASPYPIRHIYQDETIDAYLEKMLSMEYPDYNIEIINAAVTGYQVFLHTQYILSELLDYDPDLIIFFDGANDHYTNRPEYDNYRDFCYQFWKERLQEPSVRGISDYFIAYLSRYSALSRGYFAWKLQKDALSNMKQIDLHKHYENKNKMIVSHKKAAEKQFLRAIDVNLLILNNFNINAIVCLQPMLALRDKDLLSKEEMNFLHEDDNIETLYPIIKDELSLLVNKHQTQFIDMISVFNSREHRGEQLFIDYCHLSPEGSKLAAEKLFSKVEEIFLKRIQE